MLPTECIHHWIIDTPSGPLSNGVCKHCGEAREFRNGFPEDNGARAWRATKLLPPRGRKATK
jgi:hypothetical protein